MREQKKPNFIKNRKLVKTTSFLAVLLIAATLLSSGLVSAIGNTGNSTTLNTTVKPISDSIRDLSPNVKAALKTDIQNRDTWDVQLSVDITTVSGAAGNAGAEWDGSYFYTNRWASNLIHKYNPDGTLVGAFTITGVSGLRDLAYDGTYMWGGNGGGTLWKMDFTSWTLLATYTGSFSVRAIAYDTDLDIVYAKAWTDPVYKINPNDGSIIGTFNFVSIVSTYGLAYDGLTAGGPFLWAYDQGSGAAYPQIIHQWDLAAGAFTGVTHDTTVDFPDATAIAGGLFFTDSFTPGFSTLGGLQQGTPDRLFCYEMAPTATIEHDVQVKSIDAPSSGGGAGSFTPKVTVKNIGSNTETTDVQLKISKYTVPTTIMTEGFEAWTAAASTPFPPAGWAVYNVLGTNTWTKYSSTTYAHTGAYSAYHYATTTSNDDWLATNGVVVGGCDKTFSFWARSYSASYIKTLKVWMSTSGNTVADFTGASGLLLATISPTITQTKYSYDMSAYAGSTLYFAVEDISTSTYYVYVDDFHLPDGTMQGFEGQLVGWQSEWVTGTDVDNEWDCIGSATLPTQTPHGGAYMADYACYYISSANTARFKKLTPISIPSADIINMKLWFNHYTSTTTDKMQVQLSTDGCTWTTIKEIPRYLATAGWKEYTIDIKSYAGQTVYLSFLGISSYGYNIYVDDLSIVTQSIIEEYNQIKTTSLAVGEEKQLTFPNWVPVDWNNPATENVDITYDITADSLLVDDNLGNNHKLKTIVLHYPYLHDIAVTSVNSPNEDGPAQTLPVGCTITNVGQYQECCYQSGMEIGKIVLGSVFYNEPFTVNSWTPTNTKWSKVSSANAGGTAPEYRFYYSPSETGTFMLKSPAINTVGHSAAKLSFKHMVNHYTTPYTLSFMTSTDGTNWNTVWTINPTASIPATTVTADIGGLGSATFYMAFAFTGYSFNINYWYVDDVMLQDMTMVPEYSDVACTIVLDPGESMDLEFDEWTPYDLCLRQSGSIGYIAEAEQLLPGDTNPANDVASSSFILDYWHDVKVKDITAPSMDSRAEVIFSQEPYLPTESWSFYSTAAPAAYMCQDDFWDLTSPIGGIEFWGLCLIYSGGWTAGNPNTLPFELIFYEDNAGAPGAQVGDPIELPAMTAENTGLTYSGFTMYKWTYTLEGLNLPTGWISIQSTTAPDNAWLLWSGSPDGNLNALQNGAALADNLAFNLTAGGPGPSGVDVWVPLNSNEAVSGIIQNLGVFGYTDLTCYADIYEFITDPNNGTLVYSDTIPGIGLMPLGDEETVTFDNYVFAAQGIYNLVIDIPLITPDVDDYPNNNQMTLGIGCDNTKPVSTHSLSPGTPDGCNGWYVSDLTVTLDATDGSEDWQSGVQEIIYKVGTQQGSIAGGHGSFKVTDDGENIPVEYWAVDEVGNAESPHHTFTVDMDQTAPTISLTYEVTGGNQVTGYEFTFTATSTDDMSLMDKVEFYFNNVYQVTVTGPGPTYQWIFVYNPIPKAYVKAIGYDMACNNDFDELEDPDPHSNSQSLPQSGQTLKLNLGR